jgi:hypothetical protein
MAVDADELERRMTDGMTPRVYRVLKHRWLAYAAAIFILGAAACVVCGQTLLLVGYLEKYDGGDTVRAIVSMLFAIFFGWLGYQCPWRYARWSRLELTPLHLDFRYGPKDVFHMPWSAFSRIDRVVGWWSASECLLLAEPIPQQGIFARWVPAFRGVALTSFDSRWRDGQLGADLRLYAPHLFEDTAQPSDSVPQPGDRD